MSESKIANPENVSRRTEISRLGNALTDSAALAPYAIGGVIPAGVVRPESDREVAEIVKFAGAEKLAMVACGARTKLAMGMPPRRYDLALDMTRLDRILAYDPGDLTLSIEPGVKLAKLAAALGEHKQFLPLAVPFLNRATAGGTLASGVDSPLRQLYGTARDYLLGLDFVTGDGLIAKSGGRVVKNVAGYDLHRPMIGALGTLGVITKINFRTFPALAATRGFLASCENPDQALDIQRRVAESMLRPLTTEILSPGAAELLTSDTAMRHEPASRVRHQLSDKHWSFTCSFAGNDRALERYTGDLQQVAEQAGAKDASPLGEDDTTALMGRLREFVPLALEFSAATTIVKLSVLPSRMPEMLYACASAADANELRWAALARGLGVMYVALPANACEDGVLCRVAQATDAVLEQCARLGGNGSIPWCPVEWKASLKVWGPARADFELMRKLKTVFDPNGVFAPGRFAGGL
jgi:glycolate oxidase FAD binding subunit